MENIVIIVLCVVVIFILVCIKNFPIYKLCNSNNESIIPTSIVIQQS